MKNLLRLEELAQLLLCVAAIIAHDFSPWWLLFLLLGPDVGMLGYLIGPRTGAFSYNLLHHKAVAIGVFWLHVGMHWEFCAPLAIALYGHASMDRIFGYCLKFNDNFHHTHLGWIGKEKA